MNILTLNTHSWLEEQPLEKLQQLAIQIIQQDYDLIALQEINQSMASVPVTPDHFFHPTNQQQVIHADNFAYMLVQLLKKQGRYYHWSWAYNHIGYATYHEGVALLSKQPIVPEALLVSKENDPHNHHRRVVLLGQTTVADHKILALSCHYSWWTETGGFSYEWQQTEKHLQNTTLPLLLMGDFNNPAAISKTGHQLVLTSPLQLQDSFQAATTTFGEHTVEKAIDGWGENQEKLRIDYIFTSQSLAIQQYEIVFNGINTPIISDHFGVSVTAQWL